MGKGYNDKGSSSEEKADGLPESKEFPSVRAVKKEGSEKKLDEKAENCAKWSKNMLKTARISKITQEYREHKEYKPSVNSSVSEKQVDKNRYRHIFCADENRVILKDRDAANDYIHASWMEMPDQLQFISTQGPIKSTIADFWHMIYTEKCPVVVMLCQYIEDDQEKCQRYFSESSTSEKEFGEYRVKVVEKTSDLFSPVKYTVVQVKKKSSSTKHLVNHYWYHDWHDQVAPLDPCPMVKLYKTVLKKANGKPIVVHCSAGVGRTSTFIGIHLGLCMIQENSGVEMMEIMKKLRKMRLGSIQSQLQYVFLIVCIIELFIEEKYIERDALFESLLKKYSDVTKKVTAAIVEEEAAKKKKVEKEEAERKENEKKESERKKKESERKKKEAAAAVEAASKNVKKSMDEAESKFAKKNDEAGTVNEKLKEKKSDMGRRDAPSTPSLYNKFQTQSIREKSKYVRAARGRTRKSKKKPSAFGV